MKKILIIMLGILLVGTVLALTVEQDVTVIVILGTTIENEAAPEGCLFETDNISVSSLAYFLAVRSIPFVISSDVLGFIISIFIFNHSIINSYCLDTVFVLRNDHHQV